MKILKFLVVGILFMVLIVQIKSFFHEEPRFKTSEAEMHERERKRDRNILLGGLAVVGAIGAGVYWLSKSRRKEK